MIRLVTLGRLELQDGERLLLAGRRKVLAVLAFLVRRTGRPVARDTLAALFWPQADESHAKQSLRQALLELRSSLREGLQLEEQMVRLDPGSIELDAGTFEQEIAAGSWESGLERWLGEFLPGLEDLGGADWRTWLEAERARLNAQFVWAADQLVSRCEFEGRWGEAASWAERWVAAFPGDERAAACLVRALRAGGRASVASARHAQLVRSLTDSAGAAPSEAFLRLAKDRGEEPTAPRPGIRGLLSADLVGRERSLASLAAAWSEVRRTGNSVGRAMVIEAEEGLGLTRLCDEFSRLLKLTPGPKVLLIGRAFQAEQDRPLASIRTLLDQLATAPGLGGARSQVLGVLAALSPAIRERFPSAPQAASIPLEEAFADALQEVAVEAPVAIVVDDAAAAGVEDQRTLGALVRRTPAGVLVVLLSRSAEWKSSALYEESHHLPHVSRLTLEPLDLEDTVRLIASMAPMQDDVARSLAARLHAETGGRPGMIQILVERLAESRMLVIDAVGRWTLTTPPDRLALSLPGIQELTLTRLRQLPENARSVLEVAAAIGPRIEFPVLEAVAGLAPLELRDALAELVARRLLRPARDPAVGFEFPGEAERRAVYDLTIPSTRRTLHRRAVRTLSGSPDPERRAIAARHRRLGRGSRAWRVAVAAGVGLVLLTGAAVLWNGQVTRGAVSKEKRLVVVAFDNETGDPALDAVGRITADWLSQGIARTGMVKVSPPSLNLPLSRGAFNSDQWERRTRQVHDLARELQADLVVWGAYYRSGDSIQFNAHLTDVHKGELLSTFGPEAAPVGSPMSGIDRLRRKGLAALAPWLDPRLAAAAGVQGHPPSFEAYREFANGLDYFYKRKSGSIERFLRAYQLDTTYVVPLLYAIWEYEGTGGFPQIDSLLRILEPRRGELAPYDRHALDLQAARARSDWAGQYAAARAAAELAPQSFVAAYSLPRAARALNRPGEAVEFLFRIDPDRGEASRLPGYWAQLSQSLHMLGKFQRQLEVGREVRRRFPEDVRSYVYQVQALAALGRRSELDAVLGESLLVPPEPSWGTLGIGMHLLAARELAAHGDQDQSIRVLEAGLRFADMVPPSVRVLVQHRFEVAQVLLQLGRLDEARRSFEGLLAELDPRDHFAIDIRAQLGMVAAIQGDLGTVAEIDRWLSNPGFAYLWGQNTEYRAGIQALLGNREGAVRLLRQAMAEGRAYDDGKHSYPWFAPLRGYPPFEEWLRPKG